MKIKYFELGKKVLSYINHWIQIRLAVIRLKKDLISIDGDSVYRLINTHYPNANIYVVDSKYKIPKQNNFREWISKDDLNLNEYKSEIFDCDNYAFESFCRAHRIIGNITYGFAFSSQPAHAFNILISQNKNELVITQIEPQNDIDFESLYPNDNVYLIVI